MLQPLTLVAVALLLQTAAAGSAVLQGHVVRAPGGTPVPHASVVAAKVEGSIDEYRTTVTDATGAFAFRDLTPGRYRIYAVRDGYLQTEHGQRGVATAGSPITVGPGVASTDVTIAMLVPGVITGRVTDNTRPLRDATVRAIRVTYRDGQRQLQTAATTSSDDRGEYRLFGLRPGSYMVSVLPAPRPRIDGGELVIPTTATIANGNRRELRVPLSAEVLDPAVLEPGVDVPAYYPGTTSVSLAGMVDVRPGATVYAIDLATARTSTFRVSGRVALDPAIPATSPLTVRLQSPTTGTPAPPAVPITAGPFTLPAVAPGAYTLVVQSTDVRAPVMTTMAVDVADRDVEGLEIVLRPGLTVRGRLTIEGQTDLTAGPPSAVQLVPAAGPGPGYGAIRVATDGTYSIPNVRAGEYRFRVIRGIGPAIWIKRARFGTVDVRDTPLRVDADFPDRELEIVASAATATIDAQVLDGARRPVPGALVMLVPAAPRRDRSDLFVSGTADADGRVHLTGLTPGDYRAFASIEIEAAAWQDPNVLRPREARGTAVRLTEGGTETITLGLTP